MNELSVSNPFAVIADPTLNVPFTQASRTRLP
jgi:hypothetical protein